MTNTNSDPQDQPGESDLPPKLGRPAWRALTNAGYWQLEQLTGVSSTELLKLHGMGPKGIRQLREALAERGLALKGETPG